MDLVNDRIRKLIEGCGNVQGFMVNHSVGGGTGSGLGMLILERLCVDFRKKGKIGFEIVSAIFLNAFHYPSFEYGWSLEYVFKLKSNESALRFCYECKGRDATFLKIQPRAHEFFV